MFTCIEQIILFWITRQLKFKMCFYVCSFFIRKPKVLMLASPDSSLISYLVQSSVQPNLSDVFFTQHCKRMQFSLMEKIQRLRQTKIWIFILKRDCWFLHQRKKELHIRKRFVNYCNLHILSSIGFVDMYSDNLYRNCFWNNIIFQFKKLYLI